jgi:O-antigen/teichoic acid export membrane protein
VNVGSRLRKGVRSFGPTLATEGLVVAGTVFAYWYVARSLGPLGFAEYQVARASLTSAEPLLLLGFIVSLPRLVARSVAEHGGDGRGLLVSAIRAGVIVTLIAAPPVIVFREQFAMLLFGDADLAPIVVALLAPAVGLIAEGIAYGYLRGRHRGTAANLLRLAVSFAAPLIAIAVTTSVAVLMVVYGTIMLVVSLATLVWVWPRKAEQVPRSTRRLLSDSLPRVPGDVAAAWLLTIPTLMSTHLVGLVEAGFVGFGTSVIALVVAPMGPLSFVLVPRLSAEIGAGRGSAAFRSVRQLPLLCGLAATVMVAVLWLVMGVLVRAYLGEEFADAEHAARLISLSSIPLAVFLGGRSIVDAFYETARNSRNLGICLVVQVSTTLIASQFLGGLEAVALGLFTACSALALLTFHSLVGISRGAKHTMPQKAHRPEPEG